MTKSIPQTQRTVLRAVLGLLCAYHLTVGLTTMVSPSLMVTLGESFYGLNLSDNASAQFVYMLKAMGMYATFTGGLLAVACWRPERARGVVGFAALLLGMRACTRLAFFDVAHEAFAVSWGQNLFNVGLLVAQGAVLFWGYWVLSVARGAKPLSLSPTQLTSASRRLSPLTSHRFRPVASGVATSPF